MAQIDSSSWAAYGEIDPAFEALVPNLPPRKSLADYGTAANLRAFLAAQAEQMVSAGVVKPPDWTGVEQKEIQIPARDGSSLRAVVYRPQNVEPGPLAVYFHGGGWTIGSPEMWEHGFDTLIKQCGMTCVGVAYRLAPEHAFPTAAEDACDALAWCAGNAGSLGADPEKGVVVLGTSAGGNVAAVASHDAVERGLGGKVKGVVLIAAALVHPDVVPDKWKEHYQSREQNKDAMVLDAPSMDWFYEQYKVVRDSPYFSPLLWPGGHKNQPPTYMQAMGMDPLRDDTLIYEHVLREEYGVPTKLDVYGGVPHCAPDMFTMLPVAGQALRDLEAGVKWILSQKGK